MSNSLSSILFLIVFPLISAAQDTDRNIVIQQAKEEYRFIKGNKDNPVHVKQVKEKIYYCNNVRSSIQVMEFYDDFEKIESVDIKINGNRDKHFSPTYSYVDVDGIFYSDARVCYFTLPFAKKGNTAEARFEKTTLNPRYFTQIFFPDSRLIEHKEISVVIPNWMKAEIKELNFKGFMINKRVIHEPDQDVFIYEIENMPVMQYPPHAPGPTYSTPHLLILCKYADLPVGRITYFNTLNDQYAWYRQLVSSEDDNIAEILAKAKEITQKITGDVDKVKAIFKWVQENIRYIAFEDGLAGFKPEKAQEVLRKKYGDCKGMGNLMRTMLKAIGFDGRLCWLGTNHLVYDYSTPSLCVDNHVICAWIYKGKTYFLDATEKNLGFGETAERIQGRQVLIEDNDHFLLQRVPIVSFNQNTVLDKREMRIQNNDLVGKVTQIWKGESKEWLLYQLQELRNENQAETLKGFLAGGKSNFQISNLKISNLEDYDNDAKIEFEFVLKNAVSSFGKENYIELDERKAFGDLSIDINRKMPYLFPYKKHFVFEVTLELPAGYVIKTLPPELNIEQPGYRMSGSYSIVKSAVMYRSEININTIWIDPAHFTLWNKDILKLNEFYNNQLVVTNSDQ